MNQIDNKMAARPRESQKRIQKKLQGVVLRATVGGHVDAIKTAVGICFTELNQLDEGKSNSREILDTFPEDLGIKVQKQYHCHSPLMIACEDDRDGVVDVLLNNEATVALRNKYGLTAVHIVCRKGNLGILKKLLEKAKDQRMYCSKKGKSTLSSDCEAVLLARAKEGWYPVMYAVKAGHVELVKECFDKVEHALTTKKKQTVLHIAARNEQLGCLKEIIPKVSDDLKTATDKNGWNVLHHACASGNLEVLKWLIDNMNGVCTNMLKQKCECDYTPLLMACEYKKEEIVQYLLSLPDVDVATTASNQSDTEPTDPDSHERGRTALHIAAAHNSLDTVKLLIEKDCPQIIQDKHGDTALHYAYRSLSTDVIEFLELHVQGIKDIRNDDNKLPSKVEPKDVIPLEISRRGEDAIKIYKHVLKKGKQKIPRCNLLILGEEHVGKTSLYRLLVKKSFDKHQQSTRGIDDNEVDIVDERSVTMGDDWEEKPKENQEEQISKTYIDGMSETLHAELPPEKAKKEVYEPEPVLQENELMNRLKDIRQELEKIREGLDQVRFLTKRPSQSQAVRDEHIDHVTSQRPKYPPTGAGAVRDAQDRHHTQPHHQESITHRKEHQDRPKPRDSTQRVIEDNKNSPIQPLSSESEEVNVSTTELLLEEPKQEVATPGISRRESQSISKKLKAKKQKANDQPKEPTQLELKALDFAGQKQYRPMHHCFITRRAMYLVVFNLQKMIEYIEKEESIPSDAMTSSDAIPFSPIEQLRYWLYSIHAHVFPPKGDNTRRVCLVGTHRSPPEGRHISDDEIKKINERLTCEFEDDDRCTNQFHYMGSSKPKLIFAFVENSIDGKEYNDRVKSGAVDLQKELKLVSSRLKFLNDDHPLIWLRFEQGLIKMRDNLKKKQLPLFVTVDEVLKLANSHGVDDAESQELALKFFHDTNKLVYLKRVPTLYLNDDERKELAKLIILDPAWLSRVMRAVVELDPGGYCRDRQPAVELSNKGVASKELLVDIWDEFLPDTDDKDQSFHHLCTILKAYCLIYPLKESTVPNLEVKSEEPPSPSVSSNSESRSVRQAVAITDFFLIPCMLPEKTKWKGDHHLNWITFYFDFEKFLPEVLYHRFICQMIAECRTRLQCSKSWSRFINIRGCNWKIEPLRDVHRLKISVLTKDTRNLSQHIVNIHENYLRRVCAESEFQGLKYHGGPTAKCRCKEEGILKVLDYVSFTMGEDEHRASEESSTTKLDIDCYDCQTSQNVEELLQLQVWDQNAHICKAESQSPLISSSGDTKAQVIDDKSNKPPTLNQAFRMLMPLSSHWRNIGLLLELDNESLRRIDSEYRGVPDDCLREMLSLWLKQIDPRPNKKAFAEAVKAYNPALALEILNGL